jgi:hypothetical protein
VVFVLELQQEIVPLIVCLIFTEAFMDDGGIETFGATHLNTDSLRVALKENFYLRTCLIKKHKEQ